MLIAHAYANANSYTDSHGDRNVDSDAYVNSNTNTNRDSVLAYTKAFIHTAAPSDAATSPIAGSRWY